MVTGFATVSSAMGKQFRQYFFANMAVMLDSTTPVNSGAQTMPSSEEHLLDSSRGRA